MKRIIKKTGFGERLSDLQRYESHKGEIFLLMPCVANSNTYEIYCVEGNLFDDIERYDTLKEVEKRITELLT